MTSRSKELIHIELVDMRKMNELMEAHRLIFENVLTSMVMVNPRGAIIRCNRHAEQVRLRPTWQSRPCYISSYTVKD